MRAQTLRAVGPFGRAVERHHASCAIGSGVELDGHRVRLLSSSVSVPFQPGSTNPAVAWTISPRRPRLDLPSTRATRSAGSSTRSSVRPRQNSPGWMTNGSSLPISDLFGQVRRHVAQVDRADAVVVEDPERVTQAQVHRAGCTMAGSQGSTTSRRPSTSRRIVPSDIAEWTSTRGSLPGSLLAATRQHGRPDGGAVRARMAPRTAGVRMRTSRADRLLRIGVRALATAH